MDFVQSYISTVQKTIDHLKDELQAVRTGRASSTLLENMQIDAYGGSTKMKLMEMASINQEGPTVLTIHPYDTSTVQDIEKSLLKSTLGLSPKVQGTTIMVLFPELSQEQREKFIKHVGQIVEDHKVSIRNARDDIRKKIKSAQDSKTITEDDKFRLEKEIDAKTKSFNEEIDSLKDKKEKQIREV
ncbi:MAG: ribosome-recycling factor [Patescibacteria group bacterium]